jgi:aerobic-type carbon monoxide dehydrogenase small subunit (CoxS/CutS family)
MEQEIAIKVDGAEHHPRIDTHTTLLDALRERFGITSPKKAATTASAVHVPSCSTDGALIAAPRWL